MAIHLQKTFKAMGGEFSLMCYPQNFHSKEEVQDIFQKAEDEVHRIEKKFTDFFPSEFNKINELAGIMPCPVDDEIIELIEKSMDYSKKSQGLFDISFASIGHQWRVAKSHKQKLADSLRAKLVPLISYKKIKIDKKNKTVFLPNKEMKIGVGGIAKGYAVDCAYDVLKRNGLYNFYVNGSGDIRVHSRTDAPRPWKIGIRNPLAEEETKSAGFIQITNGAVATSGSYIHKIDQSDHHIISPKTGSSVRHIISATVLSNSSMDSDVTATILMNMTPPAALNYLESHNLYGVIIDHHGKSFVSTRPCGTASV